MSTSVVSWTLGFFARGFAGALGLSGLGAAGFFGAAVVAFLVDVVDFFVAAFFTGFSGVKASLSLSTKLSKLSSKSSIA
jgi:hypothetical protein